MISERSLDALCWYVVHTHVRQEDRADGNLRASGIETFAPKLRELRPNVFTGESTFITKHLFPRYIFARFHLVDALHRVRFTRGVYEVVSFGHKPTPVDEEIITMIRSGIGKDGFVRVGEDLKAGDRVVIRDGPLKSLSGIFERDIGGPDRVMILLDTLNYQAHFTIERSIVRRIAAVT